ncbi:MAG: HlyD family type I secretion periplasmic adaptor subunit [Methylococcales bacterium]|nr:HlyD family type I secretion periplasmic adaptor subunit [Methylococcales bacterium]
MTIKDASTNTVPEITIKSDDRPVRRLGYFILFFTLGIFGVWSAMAPIDSSSLATGVVKVKSHRKTVQHLEGGIVKNLWVKDGDKVSIGDRLITLDNTQFKAQVEILRGQFIVKSALNSRLKAERQQKNKIDFSALKKLNDVRVKDAIEGQAYIFKTRKNSYNGEIGLLRQRIKQLGSRVQGLIAQKGSKLTLTVSYKEEIKDLKELLKEGFADKQRLRELQRTHTSLYGEIASLKAEISSTQMQKGETELQIIQTKRKFQEEVAEQLERVNAELLDIGERLHAEEDRVTRTEIIAPENGIILGLEMHTEGGVIIAGRPILDIVPENAVLIIDAQVPLIDIDKVMVGSHAEIRFSAFSSKTTPTMEGVVQKLSADSLINEKTGFQYYQATIGLTKESQDKLGDLILISGMPAEVLINTGERTLFEYLVQPATNAMARSFIEE